jgi:nucleotide-binding universal stress UspA family protein
VNQLNQSQRGGFEDNPSDTMRIVRILVPIDFSACTAETLRFARAFATEFKAVIHLLHVVQLNIAGEDRGVPRTCLIREMSEAARKGVGKLVETLWGAEIVSLVAIREGCPHEVILQEARDVNADLIIIGTRGYSGLLCLLRRNIVARVVGRAPCPVLVVRVGERDLFTSGGSEIGPRYFEAASSVGMAKMNS